MSIVTAAAGIRATPRGASMLPPPGDVASFLYGLPGPYVWDSQSARRIPAVGRALQLYSGLTKQMPLDVYRGPDPLPRPRLLARPDPFRARSWFVQVSVEDYLLNGNALCLVTARGADGWPLAVTWLPASWCYIVMEPITKAGDPDTSYYYLAQKLPFDDVVHIRRGADRFYPVRGVGIVEEYLTTLNRAAAEEIYEANTLQGSGVPSVAVIAPQPTLDPDVAKEAKDRWMATFAGAIREPVILPNGTQIVPLAWSPSDAQLNEARKMTLLDVANIFNLDGYWLGAPVAGMTYRTAGPQYQQVLRTSLEPLLSDFEDEWSEHWLPRGNHIRFERNQLLRDDLPTTATALATLVQAGIILPEQAAAYLGLPAIAGGGNTPVEMQQQGGPDTGQPADVNPQGAAS